MTSKQNSFVKAKASVPSVVPLDMSPGDSESDGKSGKTARKNHQAQSSNRDGTQRDKLAQCVEGVDFWHDKDRRCYATLNMGGHLENYPLDSTAFRDYLAYRYSQESGGSPSGQSVKDFIASLRPKALYACEERAAEVRLARVDDTIYFDLCNNDRTVVEITAAGWKIIDSFSSPVRFIRKNGMAAHPNPELPQFGETPLVALSPLFELVNVKDFASQQLLIGWLLGVLNPSGPYPIVGFIAEQGSGKSIAARALRKLVDDNTSLLRSSPKNEQDLIISALNSRVVALDNLSGVPDWLSDGLCKLTTGAGFATRELYSNSDEVILSVTRPVMLNGIVDFSNKGDLIDRSIFVTLEPISEEQRRTEGEIWSHFEAHRPVMTGALFSIVSSILSELPQVQVKKLPRLADFAKWVTAAEKCLEWEPGSFIEAFNKNRTEAVEDALEGSLVAQALLNLMQVGAERALSAQELLDELNRRRPDKESSMWPKSPRGLSNELRRLAPGLRQIGFVIEFKKRRAKRREIYIRRPIEQA